MNKIGEKKVLIIGLDGAPLDLIKPWAEEGKLPNIKRIMDTGITSKLISTILPLTGPGWASFMTGKNPGKHGIFDFAKRRANSYERVPINAKMLDAEPFWNILGKEGYRVGVINMPATYPPEKVNGFLITGYLTPQKTRRDISYPPELIVELEREVGDYKIIVEGSYKQGEEDTILKELYDVEERRGEVALYLMKRYEWDLFVVVINGTDLIAHWFWKYMDPRHPDHDPEEAKKYGNVVLEYFQMVDSMIGKLLKNVTEDTRVIIMSDHGAGPYHKCVYMNNWLMSKGLMVLKKGIKTRMRYLLHSHGVSLKNIYDLASKLGITKFARRISDAQRGRLVNRLFFVLSFADVDWSKTKAYSMGNYGQIFINLKGREPAGIVEPGREYNELRDYIITELYKLKDPETGEKVLERIFKREDVYSGKHLDEAPDLMFIFKDMKYMTARYFEFGANTIFGPPHRKISGCHRIDGLLFMKGPHIKKGISLKSANIIDIAPTVLHILGLPVPKDMDGRVLQEAFAPDFLKSNPIKRGNVVPEEY